jgi:FixJ family two-component response regulator
MMVRRQKTIAVVDDDDSVRRALGKVLALHGYSVELYGSAEEFINVMLESEAWCLLVDIQLRDLNGIELGRELAASGLTFPIIFMTGSADETVRRQALDFGCVAFLPKPMDEDTLLAAVADAIGLPPGQSTH